MGDTSSEQLARDLEILADLFKAGGWSEIRVESRAVSLLLSTDGLAPALGVAPPAPTPTAPAASLVPAPVAATPSATVAPDPGWVAISAPNLGTFYRSPKPGAAPFIEVGGRVEAGSEVCLIEVMKLFTSVRAEVAGIVRHIAVADAELVQGGQTLIYIEKA